MILEKVNSPADIRSLDIPSLKTLCAEIREYIVSCCADNPGHLASSLGAVELIVGLHYVFDTPTDKLVFDVGHQAYAHKILTGRREEFIRNRMAGGLSGFPNRDESPWDAFGVGHASTSVSAAMGLVEAARITGDDGKVVAMIGDGAMTGGLALEGLNNAGDANADILVVLNDNEMAIDGNRGGIHSYLLKFTTNPGYNRLKESVWDRLGAGRIRDWVQKMVRRAKSGLVTGTGGELFEAFGFRYFGPVDGNDIVQVVKTLKRLKDIKGTKLLHALTIKGKGYAPAEAAPTTWHAPGRFDAATGRRLDGGNDTVSRYQDVFGTVLCDLAREDPKVVGITPAMATGSGMSEFASQFPDRFFDVGIAEEHAATFAAGLAAGGARPYCAVYSSFAQRAYDQIIHDVALQHLPVVFCFDRAGLVGEDGATHQGAFDLAAFRSIPGCVISAPRDEAALARLLHTGLKAASGPFIIRYPRGRGEGADWKSASAPVPVGKGERIADGETIAVLALGPEACRAVEAAGIFRKKYGFSPAVYDMRFLKPVDTGILEEAAASFKAILTVEEGCLKGGLFSEVCEYLASAGHGIPVHGLGIPDRFIGQDSQAQQRAACSLDKEGILAELERMCKNS